MSKNTVTVKIPTKLFEDIKKRVEESRDEFEDVEEYVEFVLTEVVKGEEPENTYKPEEEKQIKRRLKQLGYL